MENHSPSSNMGLNSSSDRDTTKPRINASNVVNEANSASKVGNFSAPASDVQNASTKSAWGGFKIPLKDKSKKSLSVTGMDDLSMYGDSDYEHATDYKSTSYSEDQDSEFDSTGEG